MHDIDTEDTQNVFKRKQEHQGDVEPAQKIADVKENLMQKKSSSMAEEGGKGS
jgi:hypothetical protein